MGFFDKILGSNTTKNDVELAKLELKKEKMEQKKEKKAEKENRKNENAQQASSLLEYTRCNIEKFSKEVFTLEEETKSLVEKIKETEKSSLSFGEKRELKKEKNVAVENLQYLYLAKDYFVFLTKMSCGVSLTADQYSLIVNFAPFFEGNKILISDEEESIVGSLKEMGRELLDEIVTSKKTIFTFEGHLRAYEDKINSFVLPDIKSEIESFIKMSGSSETNFAVKKGECPACKYQLEGNLKFCPECGTKIEKKRFCSECGATLNIEVKFCSECGHRVI